MILPTAEMGVFASTFLSRRLNIGSGYQPPKLKNGIVRVFWLPYRTFVKDGGFREL